MKTQISTSLKLFAIVLFSSLLFTQSKAQVGCQANWGSTISMCTVNFNNTSTFIGGTNSTASYNWTFGDGQTSTQQSPMHTYAASGTYSVCLTFVVAATSTCTNTLCKNVTVQCGPAGIASPSQFDLSLSVNNPVLWSTDIQYSIPSSGSVELVLFDIVGNKIRVLENSNKGAGMYFYSMNTSGFSKGIYFIHLDFEGATITQKIIIAQ